MLELSQVFDAFWDDFSEGLFIPEYIQKCINDLCCCQTEYFGGDILACDNCGKEHFVYHSCKNRFCPKCYRKQQDKWIKERSSELLNCLYFHAVVTVPPQLHGVCRQHQKIVYGILMREAAAAMQKLCQDSKFLGADIGIMEVLHTWTRSQLYHPHVHCLIPAGGLDKNNNWKVTRQSYLVPVKAWSDIFREKVRVALKKEGLLRYVPKKAWTIRWVSYAKPSVQGTDKVLKYLARYVFKAPISNSNIVKIDKQKKQVTFRFCTSDKGWQVKTLSADKFISRILQHILPRGFHKVRYYGFWSPSQKERLKRAVCLVGSHPIAAEKPCTTDMEPRECPFCKKGQLLHVKIMRSQKWRAPP